MHPYVSVEVKPLEHHTKRKQRVTAAKADAKNEERNRHKIL